MAKINAKQIDIPSLVSAQNNNLAQSRADGLYIALSAPENVASQYVSSSTGDDSNSGTRASPLKTISRAFERLPESTSGTIWLMEGDVFPMRHSVDPEWGGAVQNIGSLIYSSTRTLLISSYGPQTDFYDSLYPNTSNYQTFCLDRQYLNRPILEFGHFTFNGSLVGTAMVLGQTGGASVTLRSCEVRWAASTRAAVVASNKTLVAVGYIGAVNCANVDMQGVILPSPITSNSGTVLAYPVVGFGRFNPWQVFVPVEAAPWLVVSGVNEISFGDSGPTITGSNGVTYNTLASTVATNLSTRTIGVIKDSNGTVRNTACNLPL